MDRNYILAMAVSLTLAVTSCSDKKETRTIITTMEDTQVSNEVKETGNSTETKSFDWGGSNYKATITCKADHNLDKVKDSDDNKYYDNVITLSITGPNGNIFTRDFKKSDFNSYIDSNYLKPSHSALLSIAFTQVDGGNAMFNATVGSPCTMDDEYMMVLISISKSGGMSMQKVQTAEE